MTHYVRMKTTGRFQLNIADDRAYCRHCENQAIVVLDGYDTQHGAPCPMCERGALFDEQQQKALRLSRGGYWDGVFGVHRYSWNGGRTVDLHLTPKGAT